MMRSLFRFTCVAAATLALLPTAALAQGSPAAAPVNWHAIAMFLIFIAITLGITYWAAKRTAATDFYAAGGGIRTAERPRHRRRLYVGGFLPGHRRAGLF